MNNIRSLKDYSGSEQRRKRAGGIIIIVLLLLSTIGFALSIVDFGSNGATEEKQGFSNNGQYWIYTAGSQKYYFTYHVDEINYTFSTTKSLADFGSKQVYVDSQIPGGLQEIYNSLGAYTSRINEACYGSCGRDLPEKNCSISEPLIVLRESNTEKIIESDSCVFIDGNMKTVDAFLYKILGIRKN